MPIDPVDNQYTANIAIADLSATAGTPNDTLVDVGAAFSQATLNDNFRDLSAKVNAILAALRAAEIVAEG